MSTTSTTNPGSFANDQQARYLDSDRTPYTVVPGRLVSDKVLLSGGVAWAWNPRSEHISAGVIGDTQNKFGEVSVAFAQRLEKGTITPITPSQLQRGQVVPWPYARSKDGLVRLQHSPKGPNMFVYFSRLPDPPMPVYTTETIEEAATSAVIQHFGSTESLKTCLRPIVPRTN